VGTRVGLALCNMLLRISWSRSGNVFLNAL